MEKINKSRARKLYNKGIKIHVVACKVRLENNPWVQPYELSKKENDGSDFDKCINNFEYYNCQYNELGYYSAYYITD